MITRFPGRAEMQDGTRAEIEIGLAVDGLHMFAGGAEIETWPLTACSIDRMGPGEFRVEVGEEFLLFAPRLPDKFIVAAANHSLLSQTLTDRIRSMADTRLGGVVGDHEDEGPAAPVDRVFRPERLGLAAAVVAAVILGVILVVLIGADSEPPPVTAGRTTIASTTTLPDIRVFDLPPVEITRRWNRVAESYGSGTVPLRIRGTPVGDFEARFTEYLWVDGFVDDDGNLGVFRVLADPLGGTRDDELAVAAWGIAIEVASPEVDGQGRRRLLGDLGIDVDNPVLTDLSAQTEVNGVRYTLAYLDEFSTVILTVEPDRPFTRTTPAGP